MTRSSWRLGTCLPPGFLDQGGYIANQQRDLNHVSLVTDGSCPHSGRCLGGLRGLLSLKSLEWVGVQQHTDLETLRTCINQNRAHLASLCICFAGPMEGIDVYQDVFGTPKAEVKSFDRSNLSPIRFPSLLSMVLSNAPFPRKPRPADASIFGSLRSLILRDCASQLAFLRSVSSSKATLPLVHFEFCYDSIQHDPDGGRDVSPLVEFLLLLEGLKHLHLKLSNFANTSNVQLAIEKHQPTLKSLVYHERELLRIDEEGLFEEVRDKTPAWLTDLPSITDLHHKTALALCTGPSVLVSHPSLTHGRLLTEAAIQTRTHSEDFETSHHTSQV